MALTSCGRSGGIVRLRTEATESVCKTLMFGWKVIFRYILYVPLLSTKQVSRFFYLSM
jgi:hypothetical protein